MGLSSFFFKKQQEPVDVCIVGAGAGGSAVAKVLAEAGLHVVMLEAGRRFNPGDYTTWRPDFEVTGPHVFDPPDPARDRYTWGSKRWFNYTRVKGVGGSTLAFVGVIPRLHPSDFGLRRREGIAVDWPLTYDDLEPYYTQVEQVIGASGTDKGNPFAPPRSNPFPTPPHPWNCGSKVLKRGADKLGWHLVPSPVAMPSKPWRDRPAAIGCGTCRLGCLIRAKGSADVTFIPAAEATGNLTLISNAMVRKINVDPAGRARSVVYFDKDGQEQEQPARLIILAGNAIETPRLLLLSKSSRFPHGLANSSGVVGRYFMEHIAVFSWAYFEQRLDAYKGIPAGGVVHDFYETNPANDFVRGYALEVNNGWLWPISTARRLPGWGTAHKKRMQQVFGHLVGLGSVGEQLPDRRNRIELDRRVVDIYGLPVPRITNEPRENDRRLIVDIQEKMRQLWEAAGAAELIIEPTYVPGGSSHYMGGCRMGDDPATSVVNRWQQAHDVPNLFIADGSVFPTGGSVNPALTIQALALRAGEHIVAEAKRGNL